MRELAAEILDQPGAAPGCKLRLRFFMPVEDIERTCPYAERQLTDIWQPDMPPTQTISFLYGEPNRSYQNEIEVHFNRKISEEQMEDVPVLIDHMLRTLEALEAYDTRP